MHKKQKRQTVGCSIWPMDNLAKQTICKCFSWPPTIEKGPCLFLSWCPSRPGTMERIFRKLARLNHWIDFKTPGPKNLHCQGIYCSGNQGLQSTTKDVSDFTPEHEPPERTHECFVTIKKFDELNGKYYSDLTGHFPIQSSCVIWLWCKCHPCRGNQFQTVKLQLSLRLWTKKRWSA